MVNLQKIKTIAKEKKITLRELAKKAEISEPALYQLLRNNSTTIDTLSKIADVLGVDIRVFFGLHEILWNVNMLFKHIKKYNIEVSSEISNFYQKIINKSNNGNYETLIKYHEGKKGDNYSLKTYPDELSEILKKQWNDITVFLEEKREEHNFDVNHIVL